MAVASSIWNTTLPFPYDLGHQHTNKTAPWQLLIRPGATGGFSDIMTICFLGYGSVQVFDIGVFGFSYTISRTAHRDRFGPFYSTKGGRLKRHISLDDSAATVLAFASSSSFPSGQLRWQYRQSLDTRITFWLTIPTVLFRNRLHFVCSAEAAPLRL